MSNKEQQTFEDSIKELEAIVRGLEEGDLPLEPAEDEADEPLEIGDGDGAEAPAATEKAE